MRQLKKTILPLCFVALLEASSSFGSVFITEEVGALGLSQRVSCGGGVSSALLLFQFVAYSLVVLT